jgi:hypothetical protein
MATVKTQDDRFFGRRCCEKYWHVIERSDGDLGYEAR